MLIPKVQNKNSSSYMSLRKPASSTLSVCECFTFSFVNDFVQTQKLKSSLETYFLPLKAILKYLWSVSLYRNKWEQKHVVHDTYK